MKSMSMSEFQAYMQRAAKLEAERPSLTNLGKALYLEDCVGSVGIDPEVGWSARGIRAYYIHRAEQVADALADADDKENVDE